MLEDFLGSITDSEYGKAFEGLTELYLGRPVEERAAFEALIERYFGIWYLEDWRGWRRRRGHP